MINFLRFVLKNRGNRENYVNNVSWKGEEKLGFSSKWIFNLTLEEKQKTQRFLLTKNLQKLPLLQPDSRLKGVRAGLGKFDYKNRRNQYFINAIKQGQKKRIPSKLEIIG